MTRTPAVFARTALLAATFLAGAIAAAAAQPAATGGPPITPASPREIPQFILLEHAEAVHDLDEISHRGGALGAAAASALELVKRHHQREVEYILPPLSLLPALAAGKVTPDMRWAIDMADKVKANREEIFVEHTQITDAMNAILNEAEKVDDADAAEFARSAAADSLGDLEIQEPTSILIGEYLRLKLAPAK